MKDDALKKKRKWKWKTNSCWPPFSLDMLTAAKRFTQRKSEHKEDHKGGNNTQHLPFSEERGEEKRMRRER